MASERKKNIYGILTAIILIFGIICLHSLRNLSRLREESRERAEMELKFANYVVNREIQSIEQTMEDISEPVLSFLEKGERAEISSLLGDILARHPYSLGCFIAFTPEQAAKLGFPATFGTIRRNGEFIPYELQDLPDEEYAMEYLRLPLLEKRNVWSDPYYSTDLYRDTIISFSHPVLDARGSTAAILTEDIPLDWLGRMLDVSGRYMGSKYLLVNTEGKVIMSSDGIQQIPSGRKYFIYSGEVGSRGSHLTLAVPSGDIYREAITDSTLAILVALAFVLFSAYIFRRLARSSRARQKAETERQLMEQEMDIAHDIQMGMVPDRFPPFPERRDLDVYAMMVPARNIGGDFYDYFIRNEKLFFCIGDVSGKGVPASLLMSMCRTMFRTQAAAESNPQALVSAINNGVKELSGRNMFVTLFLGVLDLPSGSLRYCNAGHNPPVLLDGNRCEILETKANLAAGIRQNYNYLRESCDLRPGQTIFLYTDGVTEAENPEGKLFGMQRLTDSLSGLGSFEPQAVIRAVSDSVSAYQDGADQSDDLTMVAIHYTPVQEEVLLSRSITLENKREELDRLHGFVAAFAAEADLSRKEEQVIDLCLEEAAVNVILYAYPYGSKGFLEVEARKTPERLLFVLTDQGKPFDPTSIAEVDLKQRNQERQKGGLGIFLIRQNMDSMNYEFRDGKNVLTLSRLLTHPQ